MKYSTFEGVVAWSGGNTLVRGGQKFEDRHPLAVERPDLFRDVDSDEQEVESRTAAQTDRVETTMQAPGTNRVARQRTGQ